LREIKPIPGPRTNNLSTTSIQPETGMTYRSLLVLLDQDPSCEARVDAAIGLVKSFDAHLVGAAPTGLIQMPAVPESVSSLSGLHALAWDQLRDQAEASAQKFREVCRRAGLKSFEAVIDESEKPSSLIRCAHCSDLTVLTQAMPTPGWQAATEIVETVVMQSARPTLILPSVARDNAMPGRTALVAWDDSREASRAVWDALPMLRKAAQVHVTSWEEPDTHLAGRLRERLQSLRQWLAWQGVAAEVNVEVAESGVAAAIISRAADLGADFIVMGAYGHARWAERLLGGATRYLLEKTPVPLMITH
jgi:nucleotide-binding universal stress UspA family protein